MVSFPDGYLFSAFLACLAVRAKEISRNGKPVKVESKWLGAWDGMGTGPFSYIGPFAMGYDPWLSEWLPTFNGGHFGLGLMEDFDGGDLFLKAVDEKQVDVSRRAVGVDDQRQLDGGLGEAVACVNENGFPSVFYTSHCTKAAKVMAEKKVSSASCGTCTLTLVSINDRFAPQNVHSSLLQKAAHKILKGCADPYSPNGRSHSMDSRSTLGFDSNNQKVAMVLSKGNGGAC